MENSPGSNRMLPITHTKRLTCARDKDFSHRHESTSSTTDQIPKMNYEKMRDEDDDDEEVYATSGSSAQQARRQGFVGTGQSICQ